MLINFQQFQVMKKLLNNWQILNYATADKMKNLSMAEAKEIYSGVVD